jgi:hypothetical protein
MSIDQSEKKKKEAIRMTSWQEDRNAAYHALPQQLRSLCGEEDRDIRYFPPGCWDDVGGYYEYPHPHANQPIFLGTSVSEVKESLRKEKKMNYNIKELFDVIDIFVDKYADADDGRLLYGNFHVKKILIDFLSFFVRKHKSS